MQAPRSVQVDTIQVDALGHEETVDRLVAWAADGSGGYVCTVNVDYVVRARRDPVLRDAVRGARLRVPDGMGIVYGSRLAGRALSQTVTGRLLPEAVARRPDGTPIGLFGGLPGTVERSAARVRDAGGSVSVAIEPPMGFEIGSDVDERAVLELRSSGTRLLFVGLGSPKQDLWMQRHAAELPEIVMVGIGSGIDVLAGAQPAAPRWMTRIGAEWAFRLAHDPRRLARRYLWDDPRFFWWMLRARRNHPTNT
jgi:N-acetylglucosaminyldiphosphoundecaprenol N-acetyl-beta-D-mannosaminyltransferase